MTYPKIIGALRMIGGIVGWAALTALIGLFADPRVVGQWFDPSLAALIVAVAGAVESSMQASGKGALFGTFEA